MIETFSTPGFLLIRTSVYGSYTHFLLYEIAFFYDLVYKMKNLFSLKYCIPKKIIIVLIISNIGNTNNNDDYGDEFPIKSIDIIILAVQLNRINKLTKKTTTRMKGATITKN